MSFLFEAPLNLAHMQLKNRVVRSATHSFLPSKEGYMTDAEYAMYETLAKNQVGLIITGHCCVDPLGRANPEQVNIYDDSYIDQFKKAVTIAHQYGAALMPEISHAGPRAIDVEDLADVSARPLKKHRHARELTLDEIHTIEQNFIAAAQRLQRAGVDGVQLHAAHSYLLSRFIDPTFNQRTDAYGGSLENRFRIVDNIIRGIKTACGADFPVSFKINLDTKNDDHAGYHEDMVKILRHAKELGVEFVELSGVDFINQPKDATLYYLDEAKALKAAVPEMPVSLVGGVRSREDMEQVLSSGIELVSLSRALIAEPDFITKILQSDEKSICVSCCRCFVLPHMHPGIRCVWAWKAMRSKERAQKQATKD